MSHIAYHLASARRDDLLREAANWRLAKDAMASAGASSRGKQQLRKPRLRRAWRIAAPSGAAH
jgi:hypothetical protein